MQVFTTLFLTALGVVAGGVKCWDRARKLRITPAGFLLIGAMGSLTFLNLRATARAEEAHRESEERYRQGRVAAEAQARTALADLRQMQDQLTTAQRDFSTVQEKLNRTQTEALELTRLLSESGEAQERMALEARELALYGTRLDEIQVEYERWITGTRTFLDGQRNPAPPNPRLRDVTAPNQEPFHVLRGQAQRVSDAWEAAKQGLAQLEVTGSFGAADLAFRTLLAPAPAAPAPLPTDGSVTLRDPRQGRAGRIALDARELAKQIERPLVAPATKEEWIAGLEQALERSDEALASAVRQALVTRRGAVLRK